MGNWRPEGHHKIFVLSITIWIAGRANIENGKDNAAGTGNGPRNTRKIRIGHCSFALFRFFRGSFEKFLLTAENAKITEN
jgi:hypothetical protein